MGFIKAGNGAMIEVIESAPRQDARHGHEGRPPRHLVLA